MDSKRCPIKSNRKKQPIYVDRHYCNNICKISTPIDYNNCKKIKVKGESID